jgi:hypothetical protein
VVCVQALPRNPGRDDLLSLRRGSRPQLTVEKGPSAVLSLLRFDLLGLRLPLPSTKSPRADLIRDGDSTRNPTPPNTWALLTGLRNSGFSTG